MDASAERRRWTVDLALDRRWWLLPVAVLVALTLVRGMAEVFWFGTANVAPQVNSLWGFAQAVGGSTVTYTAAVLGSRGARLQHYLAGFVVLLAGGAALAQDRDSTWPVAMILLILATFQWLVIPMVSWPRWRVRPSRSWRGGVPIKTLFATTAVAAVALSVLQGFSPGDPGGLLFLIVEYAASILFGQSLGSVRNRRVSRLSGIALTLAVYLTLCYLSVTAPPLIPSYLVPMMLAWPAWAICFFHRCDRGRPTVPATERESLVAAGPLE